MAANPDVDAWFEAKKHPLETEMQRVRGVIMQADDRVEESIKWSTPTFSYEGNIVSFNPSKNFISLLFHRGAEIPGNHERLEGDGKLARVMRFADLEAVEAGTDDLQAVVQAWCNWKSA